MSIYYILIINYKYISIQCYQYRAFVGAKKLE